MKKVNNLTEVSQLLDAWSDPTHRVNAVGGRVTVGALGHRNITGTAESPAHTFSRHNPLFYDSLEPGVRRLVISLINRFDCVTYSSCQGHTDDYGCITHLRGVGLLPRSEPEMAFLSGELQDVVDAARHDWSGSVDVTLQESMLATETGERICLDIWFGAAQLSAEEYFKQSDELCARLISVLDDVAFLDG